MLDASRGLSAAYGEEVGALSSDEFSVGAGQDVHGLGIVLTEQFVGLQFTLQLGEEFVGHVLGFGCDDQA